MLELTGKIYKKFLAEFGYDWDGYISAPTGNNIEEHEVYRLDLDDTFYLGKEHILLGSKWVEGDIIYVPYNPFIKYIKQTPTSFQVYKPASTSLKWELEKDLTFEWINEQVLNVPGYAENTLKMCEIEQDRVDKDIARRNNLLRKRIKELQQETIEQNKRDEQEANRCKEIARFVKELQEEIALQQHIELGAKDNFKDTTSNDACLQQLTDTFGK